jgi:hypothetical protein
MLHGHGAIFSNSDENNCATKDPVWFMSFGSIVELDEREEPRCLLGKMGQIRGKQLILVI